MPRGLRGVLRRGLAATAVTGLVTLGAAAFTAAPASAWTGSVTGAAECSDGSWVVAWAVTNSEKVPAKLAYKPAAGSTDKVDIASTVDAGKTITGAQTLPGKTTGSVEATFTLTWPDAGKPDVSEDFTGKLTLPTTPCVKDVKGEPKPSAHITLDCDTYKVILKNKGTAPARFYLFYRDGDEKWTKDGPYWVKPGGTKVLPKEESAAKVAESPEAEESPAEEPTEWAVKVVSGGKTLDYAEIDFADCDEDEVEPSASPSASESESPAPAPVATVSVSPAANSSLPVTGASLGGLIGVAVLVLASGIAMVVITRRRKNA